MLFMTEKPFKNANMITVYSIKEHATYNLGLIGYVSVSSIPTNNYT